MGAGLVFAYVAVLTIVYALFVRYRPKQKLAVVRPWYAKNEAKDLYQRIYDEMPDEIGPENLSKLKTVLLQRAMLAIAQYKTLQDDRQAAMTLQAGGVVSDSLCYQINDALQDLDKEFSDIQVEADHLQPGWGPQIFNLAIHIMTQDAQKKEKQ